MAEPTKSPAPPASGHRALETVQNHLDAGNIEQPRPQFQRPSWQPLGDALQVLLARMTEGRSP